MPARCGALQIRRRLVAILTGSVSMGLVVALASPSAVAESLLGPSVVVPAPQDATAVPHATLAGIACAAASTCVAVGSYENTLHEGVPMVALEAAGGWSRATIVPLPTNHAHAYSASGLLSVACPAKGGCIAVGSYEDTSRSVLPLLSAQSAGTWGTGFTVGLPATAGGNQLASFASVSCVAAGTCTAVGTFTDRHSAPGLMAASSTSGVWGTAVGILLPAGAGTVQRALGAVGLKGVSCVDAKDCVAVGSYLDGAGAIVPIRAVETKGMWHMAVRAALPKGSPRVGSAGLDSVSCTAVGECVAVGYATSAANRIEPVIERESGGKWSQVIAIGLPKAAPAATDASLDGVACPAQGSCTAVGELTTTDGTVVPIVLVDAGGHWQPLERFASEPANAPHPRFSGLASVSCPAANACVGVGGLGAFSADGTVASSDAMATRIVPVRPVLDPAPPSHVHARPGPGELKVSWVPGSDGGSAISSFTAAASPADGSCTSSTTSCTISGLHDGTRYTVVVTATNSHGTSQPSAASADAVPGVTPGAPSGLSVTRSHDRATLRWRASTASPGDPVTRYVVTAVANAVPTRTCSTAARSCALIGLTRGDAYSVWVVASNAVGQSPRSSPLRFASL